MAKRVARRRAGSGRKEGSARSGKRGTRGSRKAGKDAVTLIVQLRPREGQELLLEAELQALIGPTRKEEGCLIYDLYRAAEPPSAFMLHELWASRDDHTQHTKTDHFLRWNARKDALLSSRDATFWRPIA